jgi:hypothetical protein
VVELETLEHDDADERRIPTGLPGVDRVLGGGLVPSAVVLLAAEPGISKYISAPGGECAPSLLQAWRADRIGGAVPLPDARHGREGVRGGDRHALGGSEPGLSVVA